MADLVTPNIDFKVNENNFLKYKDVQSKLVVGINNENKPKYSILIPTYKRLSLLEEAIDSAINQSVDNLDYEIIIVDNNPEYTQEVKEMVSTKQQNNLFYYKNEKNIGMIGNWNRCVELSRGRWVTFLHDDDLFVSDYLKKMTKAIKSLPKETLFAPTPIIKKSNYDILTPIKTVDKYFRIKATDFIFMNFIPTQGTMFLRKNFIKLGGYSENHYPGGPDNIFHALYLFNYRGVRLTNAVFIYRIEDNETFKGNTYLHGIINKYHISNSLAKSFRRITPLLLIFNKITLFNDLFSGGKKVAYDSYNVASTIKVSSFWSKKFFNHIRKMILKSFILIIFIRKKRL